MPRTKEQFNIIKEERKEAIIKTSLYLFALNGYSEVKIDDITKASNCSHGLFYHYFKTKDDVFNEVMLYCASVKKEAMSLLDTTQKAKFVLHDFINNTCLKLKDKNDDFACIQYLILNLHLQKKELPPPQFKSHQKFKTDSLFVFIQKTIEQGQNDGDFAPGNSYEYTIALLSMINGLAYNRLKLGAKKFICPDSQIIMNVVNKK